MSLKSASLRGEMLTLAPSSIRLIDSPGYTLNLEGGSQDNGAKVILWPHDKGGPDTWYVKAWDDLNM